MANQNLELALKIRADLAQAQREVEALASTITRTETATESANRSVRSAATGYAVLGTSASANLQQASQSTRNFSTEVTRAEANTRAFEATTKSVGGGLTSLATSVKAATLTIAAGFGLHEITTSADAWTTYQNRLRLVTTSQQALSQASASVYAITRQTSQGLEATAGVYQRFAQNADRLNITQRQAVTLTNTVSKAIAISGSSAESSQAALMQFGQALGSGVLRGDEFNSVMEQAPGLAQALADGLGVDIGALRNMANEGQLTADVIVSALTAARDSVDEKFATRIRTVGQATTELDAAFTRMIGTMSSGAGIGTGLATVISDIADIMDSLSDNSDVVSTAIEGALILAVGRAVASLTELTTAKLSTIAASQAEVVAIADTAVVNEQAAVSANLIAQADLEKARAAVTAAEAEVAATKIEAERTAAIAASTVGMVAQTGVETKAATAAAAHTTAEARLSAALEARALATEQVAITTAQLNVATTTTTAAVSAAAVATNFYARAMSVAMATGGRLLSVLGGPLGIIVSLGLAASAFIDFGDDAQTGMNNAATAAEDANVRVRNAAGAIIQSLSLKDLKTANYDQIGAGIEKLQAQLEKAKAVRDHVQALNDGDVPVDNMPSLQEATEEVRSLETAIRRLNAERSSSRFSGQRTSEEYLQSLQKENEKLQNLSEKEKALETLRKSNTSTTSELGKKILTQVDANEKLKKSNEQKAESERKAKQAEEDSKRTSEQRAKQQLNFVQQLEQQVATTGQMSDKVREYAISEQGLTGALLARAQAANQALKAMEDLKKSQEDAKQLISIQSQIMQLEGNQVEATKAQLEQQFGELRKNLEKHSETAGVEMVDKLINLRLAQARIEELKNTIDSTLTEQSRIEQSIQSNQDAGVISEIDAREQLIQLHRQTYDELARQKPLLEELSKQPGAVGEAARIALAKLEEEMARLRNTTTAFENALRNGLKSGISDALQGLAKGTLSLREAVASLAQSVSDSLVKMVSDELASQATNQIMGMFSDTATAQITALNQVTTAKVAADTTMATSSVTSANAAAAGQAGAAAQTEAQWAPAATTASIASWGAAAAIGIAAVLAALAMSQAFATGGHVLGPGTETSDSIPAMLSNNEFVTRAAVVKQPGALSFLSDFNQRGMVALDDWATSVRHATGGLAGTPASGYATPTLRQSSLTQAGGESPMVLHIHNMLDNDTLADAVFSSSKSDRHVVNKVRGNKVQVAEVLSRSKTA